MRLVLLGCLWSLVASAQVIERSAEVPTMKRFEVTLNPLTVQLNGRDTTHVGFGGSFQVQLAERFGLVVGGGYNWLSQTNDFSNGLGRLYRIETPSSDATLTTWSANGGVEVRPFSGDLSFVNARGVKFSVVLRGLAGVVGRRKELRSASTAVDGSPSAARYGELEPRFAGTLGAGLRVQFGESVALRVDVSDTLSSSRVERINGCSVDDLRALNGRIQAGLDFGDTVVSPGCKVASFDNDVGTALSIARVPTATVTQLVQLGVGMSFSF